ncbi:hypothetical protein [Ktedonobacter robiniae]|uniref:hypothetical protein n=1 Tax=Ktedonobacter robiniae TaxID=2778365 RepID=UPI0019168D1F|nr:hypothetical protein [Ktedonobacter robiniae]
MPPSSPLPRAYAGIDVAKRKFDAVLLLEDQHIHRLAGQSCRRIYGKDERPAAWLSISEEILRLRSFLASHDDLMRTTVQERKPSQKFQKSMSAPIFDGQE